MFDGIVVISNNTADTVMKFQLSFVMFNRPITLSQNEGTVMLTDSCTLTLNGPIMIFMNEECETTMLLRYSEILLSGNIFLSPIFVKR